MVSWERENRVDERGRAIKLVLTLGAHSSKLSGNNEDLKSLKSLALNGFFSPAKELLDQLGLSIPSKHDVPTECFLCSDTFKGKTDLAAKAIQLLEEFEYSNFLVGTELPAKVVEREDEFRAEFEVRHGENMRNEFGRLIGKEIAKQTGKVVPSICAAGPASRWAARARLPMAPSAWSLSAVSLDF